MIRRIRCGVCYEIIEEHELFAHLVREHQWVASGLPIPQTSTEKKISNYIKEPINSKPRLGPPVNSNLVSSQSLVSNICKYCNKSFPFEQLVSHIQECKKQYLAEQKIKNALLMKEIKPLMHQAVCPFCHAVINKKNLNDHVTKRCPKRLPAEILAVDGKKESSTGVIEPNKVNKPKPILIPCGFCNDFVKKENMKDHILHRCKSGKKSTQVVLPDMYQDKEIEAYLNRTAKPEDVGPQGKPQAKIRHGTYGLNSMEYDSWSRNNKE